MAFSNWRGNVEYDSESDSEYDGSERYSSYSSEYSDESDGDYSDTDITGEVEYLSPRHLKFTHDSVGWRFSCRTPLVDTFQDLLYEDLVPDDLPPVNFVKHWGEYYVISGNRRLLLYKKLFRHRIIHYVPAIRQEFMDQKFDKVFSSDVDGKWVWIRKHGMDISEEFNSDIRDIVAEWRY